VSSAGLRPKSNCSGKALKQLYSNLQTRPLVREGATNLQTRKCLKEISRRKKNWSQVSDGRLTPGHTDRLTIGRKLTHSLTQGHKYRDLALQVGEVSDETVMYGYGLCATRTTA
jgi:hypothetical protein